MQAPPYLQLGDTVLLIAPSRSVTPHDVKDFSDWVSKNGWNLILSPNLFAVQNQFAGTDHQRATDFIWAISHPTAKAIFTARGGYGCLRTLEAAKSLIGSPYDWLNVIIPKWLVGFSDVTMLHLFLQKHAIPSVHGPVANQWLVRHPWAELNQRVLLSVLSGETQKLSLKDNPSHNLRAFSGELVGGNLSLLYASLGTDLEPITQDKVLLIEDVDEYLYHIDRMVLACKNVGLFNGIMALLVGSMADMRDNSMPFGKSAREIILDLLGDMSFPILFDVPFGHNQENHSVKLGCNVNFDGENFLDIQ